MAATRLQKRITYNSAWCGAIIAMLIVLGDLTNVLRPLELWLYDLRAEDCQYFTPAPSPEIVYLDIDDDALDYIGRWPWHRSMMAAVLDEVKLAGPKVTGIDILYTEPALDRIVPVEDGSYRTIVEDPALAKSMKELGGVVLANSFAFSTQATDDAALHEAAVKEMVRDLSIGQPELIKRLTQFGVTRRDLSAGSDLNFAVIRRSAARVAIRQLVRGGKRSFEEIYSSLLGHPTTSPATATTQPVKDATLAQLIAKEYQHVLAEVSLERTSLPEPSTLRYPPPDATLESTPLVQFCDVIAGSGFADYNIFSVPVVRSIPLLVRQNDRLFPQFALETACLYLDADLTKATLTDDQLSIPSPKGEVRIPVRAQYSKTAGRKVGYIMDIPWYGTHQWTTMNDWPAHRAFEQHYPVDHAWTIVTIRKRMSDNNKTIDSSLNFLVGRILGNKKEAEKYAAARPPDEDFASRRPIVQQTFAELTEMGVDELLQPDKLAGLVLEQRAAATTMLALKAAVEQNTSLEAELEQRRQDLAQKLRGKIVLIGLIATATGDFVTTSLHTRCPGVVVHGVIANAILNRDFLRSAPRLVTVLLTIALAAIATWVSSQLPPARALLLVVLVAAVYFAANGLLFYDRLNIILGAAPPLTAIIACWGGCTVVRLIVESLERIRMKQEAAVIEHEISLARQVQSALIPKQLSILSKVESHGWTLAATTTGGDCFDLWKLADGRLGILVADASGHGLGPSIVVSQVRALVRALCDLYPEPQALLERINQRVTQDLEGKKFCTTFVGFLTEDGTLSWGSAGHGPMLWAPDKNSEPQEIGGTALPLGVSEDYFGDESVPPLKLEEGGWLAVVSDGIFEAHDPKDEQFGVDRLKDIIVASRDQSCEKAAELVRAAVLKWQAKDMPDDDQTIVFLRMCHKPDSESAPGDGENSTTIADAVDAATDTDKQLVEPI